jgi:hypothetical protein
MPENAGPIGLAPEAPASYVDALRQWDDGAKSGRHWSELAFRSHGVRVKVMTSEAALVDRIRDSLPPGSAICDLDVADRIFALRVESGRFRVTSGATEIASVTDADEAVASLASVLDFGIATASQSDIFIHAGVVGWDGRAIVMPGTSGSGKTTLVLALVEAGATYYSDEFAVIDDEGLVHAYARPPGVRDDATSTAWRRRHLIDAVTSEPPPLPMGVVALTRYRLGRSWKSTPGTAAEGIVGLIRNSVGIRAEPERTMAILTKAVVGAEVVMGSRGDADRTAVSLLELAGAGQEGTPI